MLAHAMLHLVSRGGGLDTAESHIWRPIEPHDEVKTRKGMPP